MQTGNCSPELFDGTTSLRDIQLWQILSDPEITTATVTPSENVDFVGFICV